LKTSTTGLQHPLIWAGVISGTLLALFVLEQIWWISLPVVLSVVIYYVSQPFMDALKRRGLSHDQALYVFLTGVLVLGLLLVPLLLPWFTSQVYHLQRIIPLDLTRMEQLIADSLRALEGRYHWLAQEHVADRGFDKLAHLKETFVEEHLSGALAYVVSWIPSLILIPFITFFILKDSRNLLRLVMRGVPNAFFEKVLLLFHMVDGQIRRYFQGLMCMMLLDTLTLALGLWILGWPFGAFGLGEALFLGWVCAVFAWVPYVGSVAGCILVMLVSLTEAPVGAPPFMGLGAETYLLGGSVLLFLAVRLLDDFFYTPLTIGRALSVHPLLTVLIVFAGGIIGGIAGLVLAMPVLGVAMVLGEIFGQVWFDGRLRARYQHARNLRQLEARRDLSGPA